MSSHMLESVYKTLSRSHWTSRHIVGIRSDRIGHFVADGMENLISHRIRRGSNQLYLYFPKGPTVANQAFLNWLIKRLPFLHTLSESNISFRKADLDISGIKLEPSSRMNSIDIHGWAYKFPIEFDLGATEVKHCETALAESGWLKGQPIVTLHVRDSAYLGSLKHLSNIDLSYHNFRDGDIDDYCSLISDLIEKGFFVIRTGRVAHKRVRVTHKSLLDLPFSEKKSDLLDFYIFTRANRHISTGSGPDSLAHWARVPMANVNVAPISSIPPCINMRVIPKRLRWDSSKGGRLLSFQEHLEYGALRTEMYAQSGIIVEDLTPEEITKGISSWLAGGASIESQDEFLKSHFAFMNKSLGCTFRHESFSFDEDFIGTCGLQRGTTSGCC